MHLASDYIHPYKDAGGSPARCRARIYSSDDVHASSVVNICHDLTQRQFASDSLGSIPAPLRTECGGN